jgi:pyrroline-5-carboxylate reductase
LLLLLGAMSRVLVLALLAVTSTASAEIVVTDSTEKETLAVVKSVPVNFLTKHKVEFAQSCRSVLHDVASKLHRSNPICVMAVARHGAT